jgi:methionyl-tRNA formyltransferase
LRLILDRVQIAEEPYPTSDPGSVVSADQKLVIATGNGFLSLEQIQPAGKRVMSAGEYLRGNAVKVGDKLA